MDDGALAIGRLAISVSKAATRALAGTSNAPATETILRLYREDAMAVAVAVIRALIDEKPVKGFPLPPRVNPAAVSRQQLIEVADVLAGMKETQVISGRRTA